MADYVGLWGKIKQSGDWTESGSRIYASDSGITGQTAFFRYRGFYTRLLNHLNEVTPDNDDIEILIVAGSIGAEAYTAAMIALEELGEDAKRFKFTTVDLSEDFTAVAKEGVYPREMIDYVADNYIKYFNDAQTESYVEVISEVKQAVTVLDASAVEDLPKDKKYDAVVGLNVLQHVPWLSRDFMSDAEVMRIRSEARQQGKSAGEIFKRPDLRLIKPFITAMADLSKNLLCINQLDETPFEPHAATYRGNIFAELGFRKILTPAWKEADINVLENEASAVQIAPRMTGINVLMR